MGPDNNELRFFTVGDWGIGSDLTVFERSERVAMEAVASEMSSYAQDFDPAFTLALGDNFYEDGVIDEFDPLWEDAWRSIWLTGALKSRPWYAILGNHDWHQGEQAAKSQVKRESATDDDEWKMPSAEVYTIQSQGVAIICFDTAILAPWETHATRDVLGGEDLVEAALKVIDDAIAQAAATQPNWLFVAGHYPVRSNAEHGDTLQLVELLLPILRKRRVDIYFCGHDHVLEHLVDDQTPLHFVISGAGAKTGYFQEFQAIASPADTIFTTLNNGFTAHVATKDQFSTKFINSNGTILHDFLIDPWLPKCGLPDVLDCPDSSTITSSSSGKNEWRLGANFAIVFGVVIGFLFLLLTLLTFILKRPRTSSSANKTSNTAELTSMVPTAHHQEETAVV
mmetsp:Transcript_15179/g.22779  ORF Transcript_15179/g.22779 Transcript_15179/m.22779 type:complete len:396 (+) Transcript_15179:57-1244(+)